MKLKELVEGGDFCVVGNSPKELNKGSGEKIDSYSCVIRMNNYQISDEWEKDYGKRTTVWAHSFCYDIERREKKKPTARWETFKHHSGAADAGYSMKPEKVICPIPLDKCGNPALHGWTDVKWLKERASETEFIDQDLYHQLMKEEDLRDWEQYPSDGYAVSPSCGLSVLYWINSYIKIKKEQVFGFDFFNGGKKGETTQHYWGKWKETSHVGERELELFKKIISPCLCPRGKHSN